MIILANDASRRKIDDQEFLRIITQVCDRREGDDYENFIDVACAKYKRIYGDCLWISVEDKDFAWLDSDTTPSSCEEDDEGPPLWIEFVLEEIGDDDDGNEFLKKHHCNLITCSECLVSSKCSTTTSDEKIKAIRNIYHKSEKKGEVDKMSKIVMSYEGKLAVMTVRGALVYTKGTLENIGGMSIVCNTVKMQVQQNELASEDIIEKAGKLYAVVTVDPMILLDFEAGTQTTMIQEKGVGGVVVYDKIVNPMAMDNPIVGLTMMTNGTSQDPVTQMAMLNMLQQKNKAEETSMIETLLKQQHETNTAMLKILTKLADK